MSRSSCLDISSAQMVAICDYNAGHPIRNATDFAKKDLSGCLLCGAVSGGTAALLRHMGTNAHKRQAHEYCQCMQHLINMDRRCYLRNDGPASRREVVVSYLSERVSQADGVHGEDRFHSACVAYLQHRMSIGALGQAFQTVHGSERPVREGICTVCMDRSATMMFSSCRHVCTCVSCAVRLQSNADDSEQVSCPVCRRKSSVVPVYIS